MAVIAAYASPLRASIWPATLKRTMAAKSVYAPAAPAASPMTPSMAAPFGVPSNCTVKDPVCGANPLFSHTAALCWQTGCEEVNRSLGGPLMDWSGEQASTAAARPNTASLIRARRLESLCLNGTIQFPQRVLSVVVSEICRSSLIGLRRRGGRSDRVVGRLHEQGVDRQRAQPPAQVGCPIPEQQPGRGAARGPHVARTGQVHDLRAIHPHGDRPAALRGVAVVAIDHIVHGPLIQGRIRARPGIRVPVVPPHLGFGKHADVPIRTR